MKKGFQIISAPFRLLWWLLRSLFRLFGRIIGVTFVTGQWDGAAYEEYVARYLTKEGYRKVTQTGRSGDMGVDIVAKKHGISYAVQCKYYSRPVSGAAVQEAVAGMAMYHCQRAMVITNSTLTKAARELAEGNDVVVLEGIEPEKRTMADVLTPSRIVSFAAGVVLFVLILPDVQGKSATSWGVYLAVALGCYLLPRFILALVKWGWRKLSTLL